MKIDTNLTKIKKDDFKIPKQNKNLHSKIHWLADEISKFFNEQKKFAMYLGIIKRIGFDKAYQIFQEVKQSKAKEPKKLFMWRSRKTQIRGNP